MAAVTVTKTIGATGDFSTLALWESGAPASLTTAEQTAAGTFAVASFTQGENLTFTGSGATGVFLHTDSTGPGTGSYITYGITTGNPAASDVVTGATSGATCVLSSGTPSFTGVVWRGECENQEFSVSSFTVNGTTTSSTAYKELTTESGASFRDHADVRTNPLRYDGTKGAAITGTSSSETVNIVEQHFRISNLQITNTSTGSALRIAAGLNQPVSLDNLICQANVSLDMFSGDATFKNCALISITANDIEIFNADVVFTNCTIVIPESLTGSPLTLFANDAGSSSCTNCALFVGNPAAGVETGAGSMTFTNCYTDSNSPPTGCTQTSQFSAFIGAIHASQLDLRLQDNSALIDAGTTSSVTDDISGLARPVGAAYDVGCWEAVIGPVPAMIVNQSSMRW